MEGKNMKRRGFFGALLALPAAIRAGQEVVLVVPPAPMRVAVDAVRYCSASMGFSAAAEGDNTWGAQPYYTDEIEL